MTVAAMAKVELFSLNEILFKFCEVSGDGFELQAYNSIQQKATSCKLQATRLEFLPRTLLSTACSLKLEACSLSASDFCILLL